MSSPTVRRNAWSTRPAPPYWFGEKRSGGAGSMMGPNPSRQRAAWERRLLDRHVEAGVAAVVGPQPFGVGGEALVQPDVAPFGDRDRVAEPLVREFVGHHRVGLLGAVLQPRRRQQRERLGLERERGIGIGDEHAVDVEGVGPEHGFEVADLLVGLREDGPLLGGEATQNDVAPDRCRAGPST